MRQHSAFDLARDALDRRFGEGCEAAHDAIRTNAAAKAIYQSALRELRDRIVDNHTVTSDDYRHALHKCAERYRDMMLEDADSFPTTDPLWLFNMEFMFGCRDGLPVLKLCRWLGYIQGVLIERGVTTVQAERDWTRPLFRPLDFPS